jgi:flagellar FliJ protein
MKRYTFALAKVLRVRQTQEELAAARLAIARTMAEAAATKEATAAHALAARCARAGLQSSGSFLVWAETTMLAGEALTDARNEAQVAAQEAEVRKDEWSSAAVRVAALENLEARGRDAHKVDKRREETKITDDIVTGRSRSDRP